MRSGMIPRSEFVNEFERPECINLVFNRVVFLLRLDSFLGGLIQAVTGWRQRHFPAPLGNRRPMLCGLANGCNRVD